MNIDDLFGGYVKLLVYTAQAEVIINESIKEGIIFAEVSWQTAEKLLVKIKLEDFRKFTTLLRKRRLKFHIVNRFGLPFIVSRFQQRKGLLLGICFSCVLMVQLLSLVWNYEVVGNEKFSEEHIIALVQEYGLTKGAKINGFDYDKLQRQFIVDHQDFSWIRIVPKGTTIEINVKERLATKIVEDVPADLVAKTDAKLTELLVYTGTGVVELDEIVQKGQIIIGGWDYAKWTRNEKGQYVPAGEPYRVQAKGIIRGEVEHKAVGNCFLEEMILLDTGEKSKRWTICDKEHEFIIWGERKNPYLHSRKENYTKNIVFGQSYQLPWQIEETIFIEQEAKQITHSREEAYQLALERARAKLEDILTEERIFLEERILLLPTLDEKQIQVEVTWLVEENIGLLKFAEDEEKR